MESKKLDLDTTALISIERKWRTTDKLYEFPLFNLDGYLNRWYIGKILLFSFIVMTIIFHSVIGFGFFLKDNTDLIAIDTFLSADFYSFYFESWFNYLMESKRWDREFYLILSLSMTVSGYIAYGFLEAIKELANIQRNLSSLKLDQYYLLDFDKKNRKYLFKLKKGQLMKFDYFQSKLEDFKQLFNIGKVSLERLEDDKVIVHFSEALPDIKTYPQDVDFKALTGKDLNFIGIGDREGTPIYSTPKEQGKGLLNGNWLIVGGSGSGKSFALKEMIQNFLLPSNYQFIDKIYVINYKASADYNFLRGLNKFEYADDIPSALKLLKKIQLDMVAKYKHNKEHSNDNFTAYQTMIIIDEVQTLNETLEAKSLHKIMKATVQESLSILEQLGSKIRASNGSLINVLQKADVNSLPSTAYRSNMRNRFMLKQENVSSAHLVVNSDTTNELGINPLKLKQGQYLYWDMLTADLKEGFVVLTGNEHNVKELNSLHMDAEAQKVLNEVNVMRKLALEDIEEDKKAIEKLEEEGKKTFADDYEIQDFEEEDDILEESDFISKPQSEDIIIEAIEDKKSIEIEEDLIQLTTKEIKFNIEKSKDNSLDLFDEL